MSKMEAFRYMQRVLKPSKYVHFSKLCAMYADEAVWEILHNSIYELPSNATKDGR